MKMNGIKERVIKIGWLLMYSLWLRFSLANARPSSNLSEYASAMNNSVISADNLLTNSAIPPDEFIFNSNDAKSNIHCPSDCVCIFDMIANCVRLNLTRFPKDVLHSDSLTEGDELIYQNVFPVTVSSLYLSYNQIKTIPTRCLFASGTKLDTLTLHNNEISRIEENAFDGMTSLRNLDMTNNELRSLVYERNSSGLRSFVSVFSNLKETLLSVQLAYNRVTGIPAQAFLGFYSLETLILSSNDITWIARNAFKDLVSLKILHIRSNPLRSVTVEKMNIILSWFTHPYLKDNMRNESGYSMTSSECLFGNSRVEDVAWRYKRNAEFVSYDHDFRDTRISRYYLLRRRRSSDINETLQVLDLGELHLLRVPDSLPNSLRVFIFDGNEVSSLTRGNLANLHNLEVLQLSNNRIRSVNDGILAHMNNLYLLDLSRNDISRITASAFCGLIKLSTLRLYGNSRLNELPKKVFRATRNLRLVYLQDCDLRSLPDGPWLHRLHAIWLYGNRFNCDCAGLAPLLINLKLGPTMCHPRVYLDNYRDDMWDDRETWPGQRNVVTECFSPSQFKGYPIKEVLLRDLRCSMEDWKNIWIKRSLASRCPYYNYQGDEPSNEESYYSDEKIDMDYPEYGKSFPLLNDTYDFHTVTGNSSDNGSSGIDDFDSYDTAGILAFTDNYENENKAPINKKGEIKGTRRVSSEDQEVGEEQIIQSSEIKKSTTWYIEIADTVNELSAYTFDNLTDNEGDSDAIYFPEIENSSTTAANLEGKSFSQYNDTGIIEGDYANPLEPDDAFSGKALSKDEITVLSKIFCGYSSLSHNSTVLKCDAFEEFTKMLKETNIADEFDSYYDYYTNTVVQQLTGNQDDIQLSGTAAPLMNETYYNF